MVGAVDRSLSTRGVDQSHARSALAFDTVNQNHARLDGKPHVPDDRAGLGSGDAGIDLILRSFL